MYALYLLGGAFERYAGTFRFAVVYFTSALAGSFGALLVTPHSQTAGASGAIFGVMGALFVLERQRGLALLQSPIGLLILINLAFTFGIPGISIGGHVGGLIGGAMVGFALSDYGRSHMAYGRLSVLSVLGVALVVAASIAGSLAVAG
jgi:membrane associated rhomboid family serine protease